MYLRSLSTLNAANVSGTESAQTQERQIRKAFSEGWKIEKLERTNIEVRLSPDETVKPEAWFAQMARFV
jgi:hypothetical protein